MAKAGGRNLSLFGDINELQLPQIAVQMMLGTLRRPLRIHEPSVHQKNIDQAVAVVVEQREAIAGGFDDVVVVFTVARDVDRREAGGGRDVVEIDFGGLLAFG